MTSRLLRYPVVVLLGYTVGAALVSVAVLLLRLPSGMLSVLLVPIIIASLIFPRWMYISMLVIAMAVSVVAPMFVAPGPYYESIASILTSIVAGGLVAEAAFRLARARVKALSQLAYSEIRFRALIENSSDLCVVISSTGKTLYVSPSVQPILGYKPEDVTGRLAVDFVHPDDRETLVSDLSEAMWAKEPKGISELRFRHNDGSWRVMEILRGKYQDDANEQGLIVNVRDITQRKKVEDDLRSSDQFNREIISNAGQGIVVFDRDWKCVVWNHVMESMTGVKAEQTLGADALTSFHNIIKADIYEQLNRALSGETFTTSDTSYSTGNPEKPLLWVTSTYGPHRNGNGEIIGVIGVIRDITERVLAGEQVARTYSETADALERERRYNEIARVFSSNLKLSEVLAGVARITSALVDADGAMIALLSDEGELAIAPSSFNMPATIPKGIIPKDTSAAWRVFETGESVLVSDYASDPRGWTQFANTGVHGFMAAPIVTGQVRLGVLELFSFSPLKQFLPRDVSVIESVGRQAGLAIQRARLVDDAQRRAQEAETLRQAGAAVASTLRLHETFERILQQLARVVPYDSASVQLLKDGYSEIVDLQGWSEPEKVIGIRFHIPGDNPNTPVIQERRPVILTEVDFSHLAVAGEIRSWLGVPLVFHDEVIGMLALDSLKPEHFNLEHARLAEAFANQVAVAIENAGLFERVQHLARTDDLTGLNNRRRFFELAERAFTTGRAGKDGLSVLMIDIDRFKHVNDTYGHVTGDDVLKAVALRCRRALRSSDILARYGGEEFVALLPRVTTSDAHTMAERLRQSIVNDFIVTSVDKLHIAVSVGISYCSDSSEHLETMLVCADQALYTAKRAGGNQVMEWNPAYVGIGDSPVLPMLEHASGAEA